MAIQRIDLSPERTTWKDAVYGEEVRGAAVDALQKTEDVINGTVDEVNQAALDVQKTAEDTDKVAKDAAATVDRANKTVDHADEILEKATQQADASADSAILSQSWAEGNTGQRPDEDTRNAKYFSRQSETSAENAKNEADRASMYADFVTPRFLLINNRLYINEASTVEFKIYDNKLYFKLPA